MNKKTLMIIGGVALLLLVGGGAFFFGKQANNSALEADVTPTVTPIALETAPSTTPTETPTPSPTAKLTPTPKPTTKPTATPTITPTPSPAVINIETSVSPSGTTHSCSQQVFTFTAKIYTNAATTVKYTWLRSDNATGPEETINFASAGMQSVNKTWTITRDDPGTHYSGWERIKVTSPNDALGNQAEFTLACP